LTTIAYRDGLMAGDSCWQANNLQTTSMTKVTRLSSGSLFGAAGDGDIRALLALLDKIRSADRMPSRNELAALKCDAQAILVFPRAQVLMMAIAPGGPDGNNLDYYDAQIWPANRGFAAVVPARSLQSAQWPPARTRGRRSALLAGSTSIRGCRFTPWR
jgi:hypothetical protein